MRDIYSFTLFYRIIELYELYDPFCPKPIYIQYNIIINIKQKISCTHYFLTKTKESSGTT